MRWSTLGAVGTLVVVCSACALPSAVDTLKYEAPPAELGRPGWVRGAAGLGSWIGAAVGGVLSIVTLPVTYPISLLADEPLGYSKTEFLLAPVTMCASGGHFALGAPTDLVDFLFRRAWTEANPEPGYEYTPIKPPVGPANPLSESPAPGEAAGADDAEAAGAGAEKKE